MGCAQTKVAPLPKESTFVDFRLGFYENLGLQNSNNNSIEKSPANKDQTPLSTTQIQDIETLKNFNILPAHFIRKNTGVVTNDYNFLSPPIGRGKRFLRQIDTKFILGAFGEVRKAVHNASGIQRAIKIIARRHAEKEQEEILMNEVGILRSLV